MSFNRREVSTYLESLGMARPFSERALEVLGYYSNILPEEIADVFISEYIDEEGTRTFESLWVFTSRIVGEANNFLTNDAIDAAPIGGLYCLIKKKDYDFSEPTSTSRLTVELKISEGLRAILKASGGNCQYLQRILQTYILPNLK